MKELGQAPFVARPKQTAAPVNIPLIGFLTDKFNKLAVNSFHLEFLDQPLRCRMEEETSNVLLPKLHVTTGSSNLSAGSHLPGPGLF
jgi:hypothetical protein